MDHSKRHWKLNLNAPIMSTRRLGSVVADTSSSLGTFQNTSERVPFSWEKEPGKPKDTERNGSKLAATCHRLFPRKETADQSDILDNACDEMDDKDDLFSDAMDDVFSLSEALDIVQRKSEKAHSDINEGLKLKLAECNGYQSPTYLINRFLPDATALAASSSALQFHSDFAEKVCDSCSYPECYLSESGRHSHSYAYASGSSSSSPKGCGLEALFPWRTMKHKFCAVESPVLPCSTTTNLPRTQRESRQKKHRSSAYIPCTNVKKDV
ncbi:unnamed protein product [Lathyrus oleraceus]|uniref:uncharacterized protein LOC127107723 n=1 Tax=Pisum sativum TaxID=3888 RepID=UPI0021D2341F|nr:uncharacterized protein LOC127107723 [Pisum sativum]